MSTNPTIEALKQSVFDLVADCNKRLADGPVDISEVEVRVKAYCEALSSLTIDEGRKHTHDLELMMKMVTKLGEDLVAARDAVRSKLESLDRLKSASYAYQKSDAIGGVYTKKSKGES